MSDYMGNDFGDGEAFDLRGPILVDTPCRRCGFNLRDLQQTGRCPQCGIPAGVSICGDLLRFSHPRWLRQVAEGLTTILWGMLVMVVVQVAAAFMFKKDPAIPQFLIVIASMIGAWGTWQMTTLDPTGARETEGMNARKLVRLAVLAGIAGAAARWLTSLGTSSAGSLIGLAFFQLVCVVAVIAGEFAKLHYIGQLARRIPDEALASRSDTLKWSLAICYGLLLVLGVIAIVSLASAFASLSSGPGPATPNMAGLAAAAGAGCLTIPVVIVMVVVAIMTIILIYRMGQAVRQQVPLAIQIWSRAAAATTQQANAGGAPVSPAQDMRPRF